MSATAKRSKIVGDNPERSNVVRHTAARHLTSGQGPAKLPAKIRPPTGLVTATHLAAHCPVLADSATTCLGSTVQPHLQSSRHTVQSSRSEARHLYRTTTHNSSSLLYKTKTKIYNILCVLLRLPLKQSYNIPNKFSYTLNSSIHFRNNFVN